MNFLLWSQFLKSRFLEINDKEINNVSDVNRTIIKVAENMAKCCVNVDSVKWWLWKDGIQPIVLGQLFFEHVPKCVFKINCRSTSIWYMYNNILFVWTSNNKEYIVHGIHKSRSSKNIDKKKTANNFRNQQSNRKVIIHKMRINSHNNKK